jgi:hypothetical protein
MSNTNAIFSTRMPQRDFMALVNREKLNFELAHEQLGVLGMGTHRGHDEDVAHLRHVTSPTEGDRVEALTDLGVLALTL